MELLREFERAETQRHLSRRTISGRERVLRSFLAALYRRDISPDECTKRDIERWLDSCSLSARSRSTYLATLRSFFAWMLDEELRSDDPTRAIRPPRTARLVPRPITDADLARALESADARMKAWLTLAAFQGFRAVEISGLLRQDVMDTHEPPSLVVSQGKGRRQRVLPLHPDTLLALRYHSMPRQGHVFRMADGRPYRAETISAYLGRHLRSLGINATGHQCRHWFGSRLYADTHDLRLVQEMLGHASPQTTAGYAAYSKAAAISAVQGLSLNPTSTRPLTLFELNRTDEISA